MTNRVRVETGVSPKAGSELDQLKAKFTNLQKAGAKGIFAGVGAAATLKAFDLAGSAISGVTTFIGESIEAASNLAESLSKSNVVFGENAEEIERWADRSAQAFGQSKQQALEAAGTYGNLLQAFGETSDNAAEMSTRMVELAADLASFNNTSVDDALQALRSGLSGETEPLKRYGIALNDARMRQALMAKGVTDLGATLTPLQKAQAAYTLILKDSSKAQGDFARTSDGLANQLRIQAAELENLKAEVGEGLLPLQLQWEKGNLDLIRSLNLLTNATEIGDRPRDKLIGDLDALAGSLPVVGGLMGPLTDGLFDEARAAEDAAAATRAMADRTKDDLSPALEAGSSDASRFASDLASLGFEASMATLDISGLATAFSDELFGTAINKGNLAQLRATRDELVAQRAEVKEGSRQYNILTGRIAETDQAMFNLQLQMAQEEGPQTLLDFLERQRTKFGKLDAEAEDLLRTLKALALIDLNKTLLSGGIFYTGIQYRHSGGPVEAGAPYIVKPDEEVFVPRESGYVVPTSQAAPMQVWSGGGDSRGAMTPVSIPVYLDGRLIAEVSDEHLYYMRAAAPR